MLQVNTETGYLKGVKIVASPNCDARPENCEPELIVIHNISLPPAQFDENYVDAFFTNTLDSSAHPYFGEIAELQVSAHIFIRRNGEITQYVPFTQRAWHAGVSQYQGRTACNDFSIGIELEGTDDIPYTEAQYDSLVETVACLLKVYPNCAVEKIVGHSDIAPGRKTDPGPSFDWDHFRAQLNKTLASLS